MAGFGYGLPLARLVSRTVQNTIILLARTFD